MTQSNYNNNLSLLPFYESIGEQDRRRPYAYGETYALFTPLGSVPPFQVMLDYGQAPRVTHVYLYRADGTMVRDIKGELEDGGMFSFHTDYGIERLSVCYPSIAPQTITEEEGRYYLVMTLEDGTHLYSDVFTVVGFTDGMICLEWWDDSPLMTDDGVVVYAEGYRNRLWIASQIGKPEYTFEDEGEQRDGYFFPEKRLSYKTYRFVMLAPEYLCDIMRLIRLSDHVTVRDQYGNQYRCDQFLMTPKWQTQGNIASVECEFTTNTVVKKIGQAVTGLHGDYNEDYNNDYNND